MSGIDRLQAWWQKLTLREQRLLFVAAISLLVGLLYWGVALPAIEKQKQAVELKRTESELLIWVQERANHIVQLRKVEGKGGQEAIVANNSPLNQVVSSSTKRFQIELVRMQPLNQTLQVWIKPSPFNQFIQWIDHLKNSEGVDVEVMDISNSQQPGIIEVKRLLLKRV